MALRIRGAKIIPTICGQVQGDECVIYGGAWQETMDSEKSVLRNAKCNQCDYNSKRMWKHSDLNLINLSPVRKSDSGLELIVSQCLQVTI